MGIENVNGPKLEKTKQILADGDVKQEEVKGLTEAEQEDLLNQLNGEKKEQVKAWINEGKVPVGQEKEEESTSWLGGLALGAAGILGVTALILTKGKAANTVGKTVANFAKTPFGKTIMLGLGGATFAQLITSCAPDEPAYIANTGDTNVEVNVDVQVKNDYTNLENLIKELIDLEKKGQAADAERHEEIMKGIATIIENLKKNGETLDQIVQTLTEQGVELNVIVSLLMEQGESIKNIVDILKGMGKDITQIAVELSNGNQEIQAQLEKILKAVENGNAINKENGILLAEILEKLGTIDTSQPGAAEAMELLKEILAKLTESVEQNKEMDTKTHTLLKAILDAINKLDGDMKANFAAVIDKLDQMSEAQLEFFAAVLAKLDTLADDGKAGVNNIINAIVNGNKVDEKILKVLTEILGKLNTLEGNQKQFANAILAKLTQLGDVTLASLKKILDAINNNTAVAKGTYEVVEAILAKIDKLGDKADAILEVIANIGAGEKVDLSKIEAMLAELLKQTKENGDVLTSINAKLNFIAVTLEGIRDNITDERILAKLDEILNKIPDGCNCGDVDLTVIIELLQKIVDGSEGEGSNNNEGILDDLDDLKDKLG